jgi:hypothetical protein
MFNGGFGAPKYYFPIFPKVLEEFWLYNELII